MNPNPSFAKGLTREEFEARLLALLDRMDRMRAAFPDDFRSRLGYQTNFMDLEAACRIYLKRPVKMAMGYKGGSR